MYPTCMCRLNRKSGVSMKWQLKNLYIYMNIYEPTFKSEDITISAFKSVLRNRGISNLSYDHRH